MKIIKFIGLQTKLLSTVVIAAVVGGAATAVVSASIPDSSGTIHGCYNTSTGALKVIDSDAGKTCNNKQTALNWSAGSGSGGGSNQIVSNSVDVAELPSDGGTASDASVLTIPNFGTLVLSAHSCDANNPNFGPGWELTNSTSATEQVLLPDPTNTSAPTSTGYDGGPVLFVGAGQSSNALGESLPPRFFLTYTSGGVTHVANVTLSMNAHYPDGANVPSDCFVTGQAVLSQ